MLSILPTFVSDTWARNMRGVAPNCWIAEVPAFYPISPKGVRGGCRRLIIQIAKLTMRPTKPICARNVHACLDGWWIEVKWGKTFIIRARKEIELSKVYKFKIHSF